jgi:leucyl-tRNA synthetase
MATRDRYEPTEIESRWQARWEADGLGRVDPDSVPRGAKFYNLVEFPYPSAEGLHVGHAYTYAGADVHGRYRRMRGREVFQPIGFDSFGIHTENFALRTGEHPATLTAKTIENYRGQLRRLGVAFDWSREIVTSDPSYYRWTQWVFLQLYRAGLAERKEAPAVWCPSCLTVLAFEQLEGDRCERCGTVATTRVTKQWFLRLTAYADQLVDALDQLDWPEVSKRLQREWIGRSSGAEVDFVVPSAGVTLRTFTTRVDTLFGVTFVAVAPDHPDIQRLVTDPERRSQVKSLAAQEATPADRRGRIADSPPRGVPTGSVATHPSTGAEVPVWVTDYVVGTYGSGAVMGVPAHDERDHAFARAMGIPIKAVVRPTEGDPPGGAWTGEGVLVDSDQFTGVRSHDARTAITEWLEEQGVGRPTVRYRVHDWLISRQRYWGPPIPIVYCDECGEVPVPEEYLPVLLPDMDDVRPTGSGLSPLAASEEFVNVPCPSCGGPARRETDVSDTFLDSAWYFLRYPSSDVDDAAWDPARTARMMPVDLYAGGREHVVRHHLYARFVIRALHDLGLVPIAEPFERLRLHGLLIKDGAKMSKSRGNVVNPDEYVLRIGADALRLALLFCGDWEKGGDFRNQGVPGIQRFLSRCWRLITGPPAAGPGGVDLRPLDRAVGKAGADLERLKFNTAIAALMELSHWAERERPRMSGAEWDRTARTMVMLLAPLAPHLAEELWARIGGPYSVHRQPWPEVDRSTLESDVVTVVVQVNGRVREKLSFPAGAGRGDVLAAALASENVRRHLDGEPANVVFVPDRVINLVT